MENVSMWNIAILVLITEFDTSTGFIFAWRVKEKKKFTVSFWGVKVEPHWETGGLAQNAPLVDRTNFQLIKSLWLLSAAFEGVRRLAPTSPAAGPSGPFLLHPLHPSQKCHWQVLLWMPPFSQSVPPSLTVTHALTCTHSLFATLRILASRRDSQFFVNKTGLVTFG